MSSSLKNKISLFSLSRGRVRRRDYILRTLVTFTLLVFVGNTTEHAFFNIFILIGLVHFVSQTIKRLHDINFSGFWAWLMIVPIINILLGLFAFFRKGTIGYNKYGADPKNKIVIIQP